MVVRMCAAVVAVLALFASSASATLVIDTFDVPAQDANDPGTTPTVGVNDGDFAATRTLSATRTAGSGIVEIDIDGTEPDAAQFEQRGSTTKGYVDIDYTGFVQNISGNQHLILDSLDSTGAGIVITVTFEDNMAAIDSVTTGALGNGLLGDVLLDISGLSIDTDNVVRITIRIDGTGNDGADISIQEVRLGTVPEPASMAIWSLLGVAMVGGRRYLRRKANKS